MDSDGHEYVVPDMVPEQLFHATRRNGRSRVRL